MDIKAKLGSNLFGIQQVQCDIQEMYNIMYLGELLERYKERGLTDKRDLRALALGLSLTKDFHTDLMFVGNQKNDFLVELGRESSNDILLLGSLYLLCDVEAEKEAIYKTLHQTENLDILDAFYLLYLDELIASDFVGFSEKLTNSLSSKRNLNVYENSYLYEWLIKTYAKEIRLSRKRDMRFYKALLSLGTKFVTQETGEYGLLIQNGYSAEEIAYLNYRMAGIYFRGERQIHSGTMLHEKISTRFIVAFIESADMVSSEVYDEMRTVLSDYKEFPIKCYGEEGIFGVLNYEFRPKYKTIQMYHFLFENYQEMFTGDFFIVEYLNLPDKWYEYLVNAGTEINLSILIKQLMGLSFEDKEIALSYIKKFESLINIDFMKVFLQNLQFYHLVFELLVSWKVINLNAYITNIDEVDRELKKAIVAYVKKTHTKEAFCFTREFIERYDLNKYEKFIESKFFESYCGWRYESLDFDRSFLSQEEKIMLFNWIEESVYRKDTCDYDKFVAGLLEYEHIGNYMDEESRRKLLKLLEVSPDNISPHKMIHLKNLYMTDEERERIIAEESREREDKEAEKKIHYILKIVNIVSEHLLDNDTLPTIKDLLHRVWADVDKDNILYLFASLYKKIGSIGFLNEADYPDILIISGELMKYGYLDMNAVNELLTSVRQEVV